MLAERDAAPKVWTEADLQALSDDGCLHEPGFTYPIADLFKEWDWE